MNTSLSPELQIEILEEERAQLLFMRERHDRWGKRAMDRDYHYMHIRISDAIKAAADMYQELIDGLQMGRK